MPESDHPEDYELFHYGVKGMKWGQRKKGGDKGAIARHREQKEAERRAEIRNQSADHRSAQKLRSRNLSSLSNQDIQKLNKRLQLETDYARLMESTRHKSVAEKGLDFVLGTTKTADSIIGMSNSPTAKLGKRVILGR